MSEKELIQIDLDLNNLVSIHEISEMDLFRWMPVQN